MESGGRDSPAGDQSRKELTISLAASSMINASDMITQEAYKANLQRIQEVKEIVRMLETNNEAAHRNFLIDQLEKRVKGGREAEDSLVRLRNQQGLSEVQLSNGVPSDASNVILPTTATLVEVPESHSYPPYFSSAPTTTSHQPRTIQQRHLAKYQWSLPQHAHRSYQPPPTVHQPSAAPHSLAPVDPGQMGWYTTSMPPQSRVHKPPVHQMSVPSTQVQQPSSYPSQVTALPPSDTIPAPGYYASAGLIRAGPQYNPSTSSAYSGTGFLAQSTAFQLPVTTYNQLQNQLSTSTFQMQVPSQSVPAGQAKAHSSHPHPIPSHPLKPPKALFRSVSPAVSNQVAISEFQRPHNPLQQLQQQPQQSGPQLQWLVRPSLEPQQHSQKPQLLPQPPLQLKQHPQQFESFLPSQQSLQPPQPRSQLLPQSTNRVPSISVSQPENQKLQPTFVQEQTRQRGPQLRGDRATFVKAFQKVVQGGASQFKSFWHLAKMSGISDEWFNAGIDSLPPGVWQSLVAQVNQSERTPDDPPLENTPQQQVSMRPGPSVPVVGPPPPPTVASSVQIAPAIQLATNPGTSAQGGVVHPASGQTSEPYAAQLRYYAERAAKSALYSTQAADAPFIPPANVATTQPSVSISRRDMPRAEAQVKGRMPRDANKSTLARDILRSLGKMVPLQETRSTPIKRVDKQESDQPPQIALQPVSDLVSAALPEATRPVDINSPSIPSAKSTVQNQPQRVPSPSLSAVKSVLEELHGQATVIEGPIMIDLTLEDSDESVDGKGQNSTIPIQTTAGAATSSPRTSSTNTTNHTPLLENLSLEEPSVDVAADGDNADTHMHGPPSSPPPVSEENMNSSYLHPSLGSSEPVSPCFQRLPQEASEYLIDGQLPLFLPSPPVSPVHTEPPESDLEMTNDEGESTLSLKRHSVDVNVTGIDAGPATPQVKKRRKQQVYVLIPPAPPYVKKAIKQMKGRAMGEGIGSEGAEEDEELQYSHLEQLLIEESRSRLLERRCWWLNCSAILNCAANLLAHLRNHAREEGSQAPFLCRWANCQRRFGVEQERDIHLERHTVRPLPCPFSGCDEQFDKPVEVMQHEVQHQKTDRREPLIRKPTSQPIVPAIPARLGAPPQRLPSHRVTPRRVIKCRISADRHATVGPWVLWNIFSPIDLNVRKQNASMRCRPTRQPINYDTDSSDPRRDDYDFLLALSSYPAKNPQPDDLDSTLVTMSAARGLTLWGSEPVVNGAARSATPEGCTSAASAAHVAVPGSATEGTKEDKSDARWSGAFEERQSMAVGEKDAAHP